MRYSFMSNSGYASHVLSTNVNLPGYPQGPAKDIIEAGLAGDAANVAATVEGTTQISSSVKGAAGSLSEAVAAGTNGIILGQALSTAATVGAIAVATRYIGKKIDEVNTGIDRLGVTFTEGMSLLSAKLDIQSNTLNDINDQLKEIHGTLKSPLLTQAEEQKSLGFERIAGDLYPEAMSAFQKVIDLNEADAISHMMLGKLFLDGIDRTTNLHDPINAEKHFRLAVRYARAGMSVAPNIQSVLLESIYLHSSTLTLLATSVDIESTTVNNRYLKTAEAELNESIRINPSSLSSKYLLIKVLIFLNKIPRAKVVMKDILDGDDSYYSIIADDLDIVSNSDIKDHYNNFSSHFRIIISDLLRDYDFLVNNIVIYEYPLPDNIMWVDNNNVRNFINSSDIPISEFLLGKGDILNTLRVINENLRSVLDELREKHNSNIKLMLNSIADIVDELKADYYEVEWFSLSKVSVFKRLISEHQDISSTIRAYLSADNTNDEDRKEIYDAAVIDYAGIYSLKEDSLRLQNLIESKHKLVNDIKSKIVNYKRSIRTESYIIAFFLILWIFLAYQVSSSSTLVAYIMLGFGILSIAANIYINKRRRRNYEEQVLAVSVPLDDDLDDIQHISSGFKTRIRESCQNYLSNIPEI